ncbi:hypothetical protein DF185_01620 [Marinifilum breve]|uniref:Uncharacterized protein n=1 Tax=Marinifilum breve TaxID=2184082 RepID=A0A2V4A1P3_9BACT|nr:DNA-binding domain-containing protein [Marinifilum breve]PXY02815.1 hypothetical protein DF185_01620 [Marinifilum breve]
MEKKTKKSVNIELHDWALGDRKGERIARVVKTKSINTDDLVKLVIDRRTEFSASTLKASFELMKNMAIDQIMNGASVHFGLGHFQLNANGIFNSDNAGWDKDKHNLSVKFSPAKEMKSALNNCEVNVLGKANSSITINTVTDLVTKQINKCLTPGGGVDVSGKRIKIAGDKKEVGIKLLKCDTNEEILIPRTAIMQNTLSCIKFVVPHDLQTGFYQLVIVSQYTSNGSYLKKPKTYIFPMVFEVA